VLTFVSCFVMRDNNVLERYVGECDAGHAVLVDAINACVDICQLQDGDWGGLQKLARAAELLWRAAQARRAAALLKLAAVMANLDACVGQLKTMPEELRQLVQDDFDMRKAIVKDLSAGTNRLSTGANRSHKTMVLYQDVWRLSPHLTDSRFAQWKMLA
jgi:septum formation inhibitor-activating ATPase MinD